MGLNTVRVPPDQEPFFARAEEIVSQYFRDLRRDPAHGTIEIHGERYVLVRAAALSVEFFSLVEELYGPGREAEADEFARNILFDLAHAVGKSDAHSFCARTGVALPVERLAAGPVHFSHAGWAFVEILPESRPVAGDDYYLLYDHPYSFESDAWLRAGRRRENPVCIMNAGYSSGWCEDSFGLSLVAVEVLCRARGDDACRFIMAPPARIEAHLARFRAERGMAAGRPPTSTVIPDFFSRKRMEEELRHARDELERRVEERTRELTLANERLVREIDERERAEGRLLQTYKLEAVGRLAGGIAHDFNNLMAIITVNCDLLRRRLGDDPALTGFVDDIAAAGGRAAALTQQLLAFSRAQPAVHAVLDLNEIVADLGRMLVRVIGEDVLLVTRLADHLAAVEADRGQLEQVLMNLVVNARDAMPAGGTLTIETESGELDEARAAALGGIGAGRCVILRVSDTGSGMDEATLAHIFDPFFTTKGASPAPTKGTATAEAPTVEGARSTHGTGLGLATVYGIVKQASGAIAVTSAPGQGTRISIYLPCSEATAPARREETRDAEAHEGTETILVVEDQPRLRDVLAVVLRGFGYEVLAAKDAEDAVRLAESHAGPIELLLTDVVMPRTSGPQLAARIQRIRAGIQVLFMSGYTADAMVAHGGPGAGTALLQKPFGPDELGRAVRTALGGSAPNAAPNAPPPTQLSSGSSRA